MSRLTNIPITRCWEKVRFLEAVGMIRNVLSYVGKNGRTVRYYETINLPEYVDGSDAENRIQLPYLC